MPNLDANAEQIAYWNDEGPTWVGLQMRLDRAFAPLTAALLERAAPEPGESVLDVGCGCGTALLAIARRLVPHGDVIGVDVSKPMIATAEHRAGLHDVTNARFLLADASTHDFDPGAFDLVFSQFGVMFFADPAKAFGNLRRSMRPKARLQFMCWRGPADNEQFSVQIAIAKALFAPFSTPDPAAPGPMALADPDRIRDILAKADFSGVEVDPFDASLPFGSRADATDTLMRIGVLGRLLAEHDGAFRGPTATALDAALRAYETSEEIALRAGVWLVRGRA